MGDADDLGRSGLRLPDSARLTPSDLGALDTALRLRQHPGLILTRAVSGQFDCLDVARLLAFREFRGRFRVLVDAMPCPSIVIDELRAVFTGLDIAGLHPGDPVVLQPAFPISLRPIARHALQR
ncbi:hypothetical protein [Oceaniovalibus sp. ACAM 378]|uniref:hypothetical protein n=1 Tax=Oceaniovalibus sp. ACAM 378 TaxID=2599923 RepID=UPI0011D91660|nr:hypothetical protein [Oceaniovalibus sp. ACAM 378]TYB90962.1 hypothetical protein FQ320_00145 [Oceaniovalibus sp. ACAM 378]